MKKYIITSLFVLSVGAGLAEAAKQSLQTVGETTHGDVRTTVNTNATRSNSNFTELYNRKQTGVTDWTTNGAGYTYAEDDLVKYGDKIYIALGAHVQDAATPDISDDFAEWAGGGPGDNPSFNSVNASSGNLAAANAQVTKKWITGLSYTADVTSVIHGGQHYICTSTHTAGASTEPGIGASWQTVWTLSGGAGDDLGSADYTDVVALWTTCSGYLKSDGTCDTPSGTFTYPGSGIPNSTGSAWGTSYSLDTDLSSTSASDDTIPSAKATKALFDLLPSITWGTGLTDTSNTISVTYPVTAEAWSGSGWNADTDGATRNDVYDYAHIMDPDDDGKPSVLDMGAGIVKTDSSGNVSAATAGSDYSTPSSSDTLTNKTFDANGTGNTLKGYGYITFTKPHNRGSATGAVGTTETSILYGIPSFADDVETNNYVDYIGEVPRDLDTAVDLVAYFKFRLGGADTGDHSYKISMIGVADSGTAAGTPGDSITLAYTADASGADGDVETATETLTDWKTNATAGSFWLIRVTRDGDDGTNDTSTVDSYPLELTIRYGFSQ